LGAELFSIKMTQDSSAAMLEKGLAPGAPGTEQPKEGCLSCIPEDKRFLVKISIFSFCFLLMLMTIFYFIGKTIN